MVELIKSRLNRMDCRSIDEWMDEDERVFVTVVRRRRLVRPAAGPSSSSSSHSQRAWTMSVSAKRSDSVETTAIKQPKSKEKKSREVCVCRSICDLFIDSIGWVHMCTKWAAAAPSGRTRNTGKGGGVRVPSRARKICFSTASVSLAGAAPSGGPGGHRAPKAWGWARDRLGKGVRTTGTRAPGLDSDPWSAAARKPICVVGRNPYGIYVLLPPLLLSAGVRGF